MTDWLTVLGPLPGSAATPTAQAALGAACGWQAHWAQAQSWMDRAEDFRRPDTPSARKEPHRDTAPVVEGMPVLLQQRPPAWNPQPAAGPEAAAVLDVFAGTDDPPQPHAHVETGADGLSLWLGLPGPAPQAQALLAELLPRLRRELLYSGQTLAAVICNGQPLGGDPYLQEP